MDKTNLGTSFKMNGDWNEQSQQLKARYPKLTNEDLIYTPGELSFLLKRIEARLNKNREDVINILRNIQEARS